MGNKQSRRKFIGSAVAMGAMVSSGQALAQEVAMEPTVAQAGVRRNIGAFSLADWRDHYDDLRGGVIISDTTARVLQYWSADGNTHKIYPTSVPLSEDLTRLGYTEIIRKVEGPSWAPTPNMLKRNPDWPRYVGPGPDNPLGTHALYLSWQYYRIHGTNDTRKIGRRSSNGCIGLYNEQIADLFGMAEVGTKVKLI